MISVNQTSKANAKGKRLQKLLEHFPYLPDIALVEIDLIRILSGRSPTSIRRDISAGRLCPPTHIGPNCSRWPVGAIRQYLTGL